MFEITCKSCGSHNVGIREDWSEDYDWDENLILCYEGSYLECNDCGANDYWEDRN